MSESLSKAAKKNAKRHAAKRAKRLSEEPTRASEETEKKESTESSLSQNEGSVCGESSVKPSVICNDTLSVNEAIAEVKRQLDEAKEAQNHEQARKLRRQLWTLKDKAHLGSPGLDAPDVSRVALSPDVVARTQKVTEKSVAGTSPQVSQHSVTDPEKKLRNLKKKLRTIDELKAKKENGNKLEETQLAKIASENEIIDEIKEIEDLLATTGIQ